MDKIESSLSMYHTSLQFYPPFKFAKFNLLFIYFYNSSIKKEFSKFEKVYFFMEAPFVKYVYSQVCIKSNYY